jgi:hypothetical protein
MAMFHALGWGNLDLKMNIDNDARSLFKMPLVFDLASRARGVVKYMSEEWLKQGEVYQPLVRFGKH